LENHEFFKERNKLAGTRPKQINRKGLTTKAAKNSKKRRAVRKFPNLGKNSSKVWKNQLGWGSVQPQNFFDRITG